MINARYTEFRIYHHLTTTAITVHFLIHRLVDGQIQKGKEKQLELAAYKKDLVFHTLNHLVKDI